MKSFTYALLHLYPHPHLCTRVCHLSILFFVVFKVSCRQHYTLCIIKRFSNFASRFQLNFHITKCPSVKYKIQWVVTNTYTCVSQILTKIYSLSLKKLSSRSSPISPCTSPLNSATTVLIFFLTRVLPILGFYVSGNI